MQAVLKRKLQTSLNFALKYISVDVLRYISSHNHKVIIIPKKIKIDATKLPNMGPYLNFTTDPQMPYISVLLVFVSYFSLI